MKSSGLKTRKRNRNKIIYLEDGFIHSYGLKKPTIPLGICFDPDGIYYHNNRKSKLFNLVKEKLDSKDLLRSRKIINLWKELSISKYNFPNFITPPEEKYILLIDQTFGDLSLCYGGGNSNSFYERYKKLNYQVKKVAEIENCLVSIVIPTYNGGKILLDCIEMLFKQDVDFNFEKLIIDSSSDDKSVQSINNDKRISNYSINQKDFQHGRTRNLAVSLSKGEYVAFLTQDAIPFESNSKTPYLSGLDTE